MKLSLFQRRGNGDVISTLIEPVNAKTTTVPELHSIKCERREQDGGIKTISRFYLDTEAECWDLLREISSSESGFIGSNPKILRKWEDNKLEVIYS